MSVNILGVARRDPVNTGIAGDIDAYSRRAIPFREATAILAAAGPPFTFRLPAKGGDPHFGLTRAWYYQAEAEGQLQLVRLRMRGKSRGVTLVRYDDVKALMGQENAPT